MPDVSFTELLGPRVVVRRFRLDEGSNRGVCILQFCSW